MTDFKTKCLAHTYCKANQCGARRNLLATRGGLMIPLEDGRLPTWELLAENCGQKKYFEEEL